MSAPNLYRASVNAVSLTASTTLTLLQVVTGSTRQAYVKQFGFSFNGTDSTKAPILCQLIRQTTAGTSSALTLTQDDPTQPAPISTALQTFTAEPTSGDIVWSEYITPAGGFDRVDFPLGEEIVIGVSGRIALRVVTPSAAVSATGFIRFSE